MVKRAYITFQDGMAQDVDKLNHPKSATRYSLNCRIIFNKDGTYSWVNENGMKLSLTLNANSGADANVYIPLGSTGQSNLLVLFTTSPVSGTSEIGIAISNQYGICSYKTLFNDQNDPNGDLFMFDPNNQIEARFVYETDDMIRAYWVDGVTATSNRPRVFTFKYDPTIGPPDDVNAYSAVTVSVHDSNSQSDFSMGLIKYVQVVTGNLKSGVYQYTYRLGTSDGYQTPWFPLSRTVFLTSDGIDNVNWNKYEMEGSGIVTSKGNRIEIKGIDLRFTEIEVAYVYSQTASTVFDSAIFSISAISGATMTFDHVANTGEPLIPQTIPTIFQGIKAAKTLNIKDNVLYEGNIVEGLFNIEADVVLAGVTAVPVFRDMRSDERVYSSARYPITVGSPPISHQVPKTGTSTKKQHNSIGGNEVYQIVGDYTNYKGTQVEHIFQGYFRGETYRFGIVFFDLLGFPSFVYHLSDVTFPDQYQDTYSYVRIGADGTLYPGIPVVLPEKAWPTNNYGDYTSTAVVDGDNTGLGLYSYLRIMGIEFSGIDISSIVSQISGFQIVRCKAEKSILMQGLIMPCVREDTITRPFVSANQSWLDAFTGALPGPGSDVGDIIVQQLIMIQPNTQPTTNAGPTDNFLLRPNISTYYAPDVMFSPAATPVIQSQDQLKLVGGCWTETNPQLAPIEDPEYNQYFTYSDQCLQNLYYSKNNLPFSILEPFPQYGNYTNPTELLIVGLGGDVLNYAPGLDLNNSVEFEDQDQAGFSENGGDGFDLKGWGKDAMFFIHPNFNGGGGFKPSPIYNNNELPFSGTPAPYSGYFICNYVRPNSSVYGGQTLSALERNLFMAVGHFQPVNNPTFITPVSNIFNEIEIWGGDCYLDYFSFLRVYGREWNAPGVQNERVDVSYGHSFPLESVFNHTLRQAPSTQNPMFPDVGARPNEEVITPGSTNWPNGLFYRTDDIKLLEEFNINGCLLYEESIQFYNPKTIRFQEGQRRPVRWRYTPVKFYGEPIDQWRIFQVNDFADLNAQYGEITSSVYLMDQIYSWQQSAFGRLRALDRAMVESLNLGSLTTGIGGKLDGIDYISTVSGNQHQWSLFTSGKAAYWINVDFRKICRFAQDGYVELSDLRGEHQFAEAELPYFEEKDNPAFTQGIFGVFDHKNKEAKWSFIRDRKYLTNTIITLVDRYSAIPNEILVNDDELIHVEHIGILPLFNICIIPVGNTSFGSNKNMNFYLYVDPMSLGPMPVYLGTTIPTLLFTAVPGLYYQIYRNKLTDLFTYKILPQEPVYKKYNAITYNEMNDHFVMFNSYESSFFATIKDLIISYNERDTDVEKEFYVHDVGLKGEYYDKNHSALLDVVISENGAYAKTFDDMYMNVTDEVQANLVKVSMYCDSMFYDMLMGADTRIRYQEDKLRFPLRTEIQPDRMRGKHLRVLFELSNDLNRELRFTNLEILYRLSPRV